MKAPCSPFLMITILGPRSMIHRAAFTRLKQSVSCRASPSLSRMRSTCESSARRSGRRLSIQKFIVSHATSFGRETWVRTSSCNRGSMFPRKTNGASRNASGILGRKFEKTPRCVSKAFRPRSDHVDSVRAIGTMFLRPIRRRRDPPDDWRMPRGVARSGNPFRRSRRPVPARSG